jgi:hypothetical protein
MLEFLKTLVYDYPDLEWDDPRQYENGNLIK